MKQVIWIVFAWFATANAAHTASFDCTKAQIKVEKKICADAELSKLDEDLTAAYAAALKTGAKASTIRQAQKLWVKERNRCVDAACLKNTYQNRALVIAQSSQNSQGIEALYGKWEAGGKAGIAIYGTMEISKSKITWKGFNPNPRCTVSYEQVPENDEAKFKDNSGHFQNISPFKSYLLAIHGGCDLKITHFRLTLPNDIPNYLDMVEYCEGIDEACGYVHFYKR